MIESIIALAQSKSPEKRRKIMDHVSELFVEGAEIYKDDELHLFNKVLEGLLETMCVSDKCRLSQKIAKIDQISRDLAFALASDQETVAENILRHATALTDADLLKIAKTKGQGHLLAISQRDQVQPRVSDVLIERGDLPVHQSLAANPGAAFSKWGERMLVKRAESDPTLRETLCVRPDFDEKQREGLFEQMSDEAASKLRSLLDTNAQIVEDLFRSAGAIIAEHKVKTRGRSVAAKAYLQDIRRGQRSLDKVITRLALSNALEDVVHLLSEMSGIHRAYIKNGMSRRNGEALAIISKACGLGDLGYSALCRARCRQMKLPESAGEKWLADFRVLKEADARRALAIIKLQLKSMESQAA
ncbi:DUF2336 domain-containing protein [Roseibium aquae]|nr:DUF2336 domain-containing protein [Roseibium aquae]